MVNDRIVDDEVRSELALLAPDLIGLRTPGPQIGHCVVAACLGAAASIGRLPPRLARRLAGARARSRPLDSGDGWVPSRWQIWQARLTPAGAGLRWALHLVVGMMEELPSAEQDARLRNLLRDTIVDCRKLLDAKPAARPSVRTSARNVTGSHDL